MTEHIYIFIIFSLIGVLHGQVLEISEQKSLKKFLRTHTNVLIFYQEKSRSGKDWLPALREAAIEMEGRGSVVTINCETAKKLCKRMKVKPSPVLIKHYKDGKFHKDYDRSKSAKSVIRFLEDPTGDVPWDEDQSAHSVVHLDTDKSLVRLVTKESKPILLMFYAPWCGYCKRLKPEYAAAATDLKHEAILAGMDVDKPQLAGIRKQFNITGFPTLFYIKQGRVLFKYGGETTKDGIVRWMRNPQPPKEPEEEKKWSDEDGAEDVHFLTTDTFDDFLKQQKSVLVMFYAPWCGHCKAMKPAFNEVSRKMRKERVVGALAAVDATKESQLAEKFKVKGFPTVKYFKDGEYAFDFNERTTEKLMEFMKDPKEPPPPPPPEKAWTEEKSEVQHLSSDNYHQFLRKKKHVLVMLYAPWCGHCKKAKPEFTRAAEVLKEDRKVSFAAMDCTQNSDLCTAEGVEGFPTFLHYNFGKKSAKGYTLGREEEDFVAFMQNPDNPKPGAKRHWKGVDGAEDIVFLTTDSFDAEMKGKEAFVKFYAPWCGHCQKMKPAFAQLAGIVKNTMPQVVVGAVDATEEDKLASKFGVSGYPSLLYIKSDGSHEKYRGARTVEDMLTYIQSKNIKEEKPKATPPPPAEKPKATPPPPKEKPKATPPPAEKPKATPPPPKEKPKATPPPPQKEKPKSTPPPQKEKPKATPPPAEKPKATPPPPKEKPKSTPPPPAEKPKATPPPPKEKPKATPPPQKEKPKATPPPQKEKPKATPPPQKEKPKATKSTEQKEKKTKETKESRKVKQEL